MEEGHLQKQEGCSNTKNQKIRHIHENDIFSNMTTIHLI